jgi:nucleoside-diphosphate-sugar epimerase
MMIYVTGASGFVGSEFVNYVKHGASITPVSYRREVTDVFDSHENASLVHLGWSTTPRDKYDTIADAINNDVLPSKQLFDMFAAKNPNGKIIFTSSGGDLLSGHDRTVDETTPPVPKTLYGECKLQVENILKTVNCNTTVLRVSNVWGGKNLGKERKNGLVDKLIAALDTDEVIDLYANLDTRIDLIHVSDLCSLLADICSTPAAMPHQTFVVGAQSLTIKQILERVAGHGALNLRLRTSEKMHYTHIENRKVRSTFNWSPKVFLT